MPRHLLLAFFLVASSASARATDVSYTYFLQSQPIGSSTTLNVPQFDPTLGSLFQVQVRVQTSVSGAWFLENTSASPISIGGGVEYVGTQIPVTLPYPLPPGSAPALSMNPAFELHQLTSFSAFDGTLDYAGTSGTSLSFSMEQGSGGPIQEANYLQSGYFPLYTGNGSVAVGLGPITQIGSLPAAIQSLAAITADINVTVRYSFEPFPAHICRPLAPAGGCPCGNYPSPVNYDNGCGNSLNPQGGRLDASGNASIGTDSLVLSGSGMTNASALYFQGSAQDLVTVYYGDGLRCVGGTVLRLGTKINAAGASQYPVAGDLPISVRGNVTQPGIRYYQVVYRNQASFCTPDSFNITSGLAVLWAP